MHFFSYCWKWNQNRKKSFVQNALKVNGNKVEILSFTDGSIGWEPLYACVVLFPPNQDPVSHLRALGLQRLNQADASIPLIQLKAAFLDKYDEFIDNREAQHFYGDLTNQTGYLATACLLGNVAFVRLSQP